jgi:hypothetical protein
MRAVPSRYTIDMGTAVCAVRLPASATMAKAVKVEERHLDLVLYLNKNKH